jgi:hypothetical protein
MPPTLLDVPRRVLSWPAQTDGVICETTTGSATYYRMPVAAGQVALPWELRDWHR